MNDTALMIDDCIKRESKLNQWEVNFIQSLSEKDLNNLTQMQLAKLDEIWERIT